MITYKVVLDERRVKAGGKYPLVFRVTCSRSSSNYYSGLSIAKEHWDSAASLINKHCPNYKELNRSLTTKFLNFQKLILDIEAEGEFTFDMLRERLTEKPKQKVQNYTFLTYSQLLISELIEVKRTGNAIVYQTAVNRVMKFSENKQLRFEHIDYNFLDKFKHQLAKDGVKQNTVGNYLRSIRAIYNKAIKAKLVERKHYPFTDISIKTEKTAKRSVSIDNISALSHLQLKPKSPKWYARAYFLLSFSLIGMSFTDLAYVKNSNIVNGRLIYKRRKTHKGYNIKLTPLTIALLNDLKRGGFYLLPVLKANVEEDSVESKKIIHQWIKTSNKWLKRIGADCGIEHLTTYVARHTWATTAKRMGYSIEVIAEAMGHEHGNRITNIYLDTFDQDVIDDVNAKVVEVLNK
ncbi:phage integrase SAM-like domain-containing protein [Mucilaginibacter calamicampi]|uniref:Phage integrase SAM-like domain-containing protein n=1 Tax=Mucilaginibacter calamicampi TaxID=1302352 RepID=A0ABW2Z3D0_9SPHI